MSLDNIIFIKYDAQATTKEHANSFPKVTKVVMPCQFQIHSSTLHFTYIFVLYLMFDLIDLYYLRFHRPLDRSCVRGVVLAGAPL